MSDKTTIIDDVHLANIHRLAHDGRDLLVDDQTSDVLALPSCGSPSERICTLFFDTFVRLDKVTQHLRARCSDDARIDV